MDLFSAEMITYEEAIKQCTNPDDFALKVKGIESTEDLTWAGEKDKIGGIKGRRGGHAPDGGSGEFKIDRFQK